MRKGFTLVWCSLLLFLTASVIVGQTSPQRSSMGFPVIPRIVDVDPSVTHEVIARIPERLKVTRGANSLSVSLDLESLRDVKLLVGKKMVTGVECELRIYPERRASEPQRMGLSSSIAPVDCGASILNTQRDGIPIPGTNYTVEEGVTIFETDVPAQHFWSPKSSPDYRILWRGVVKSTAK
jgi:hypothetical protein